MERNIFGRRTGLAAAAIMAPGLLVYAFIMVFPLLSSLRYSMFNWRGGAVGNFVGLSNYAELLADRNFWFAFRNNLVITGLCIVGQLGIAFVLTCLILFRKSRLTGLYRTVLFLPVVLSPLVVGFVWRIVFNRSYGLLNALLRGLGLGALVQPWLDKPSIVIFSVAAPIIWQYIGYYTVIFLGAASSIPREIYEVAEIDGVPLVRQMVHITLPLIFPTIIVATMLCIAGNMQVFDHIYVMTGGGPGVASTVMAQYAYQNAFIKFRLGYANAVSIGMLVLSLGVVAATRLVMGRAKAARD